MGWYFFSSGLCLVSYNRRFLPSMYSYVVIILYLGSGSSFPQLWIRVSFVMLLQVSSACVFRAMERGSSPINSILWLKYRPLLEVPILFVGDCFGSFVMKCTWVLVMNPGCWHKDVLFVSCGGCIFLVLKRVGVLVRILEIFESWSFLITNTRTH